MVNLYLIDYQRFNFFRFYSLQTPSLLPEKSGFHALKPIERSILFSRLQYS